MKKDDNSWELKITEDISNDVDPNMYSIEINKTYYIVSQDIAALTHAILLLVDAVNDKYNY